MSRAPMKPAADDVPGWIAFLIITALLPAACILKIVLDSLFWIGFAAGVAMYHFCIATP